MKKMYILLIFLILFFANNLFAFTPTFYIGDGVSGQSPQCQTPTYNSTSLAILDIKSQGITSANLIVCEGTYQEQIIIADMSNIFLIGENENVFITSQISTTAGIVVTRSEAILIKNIDITSNSKNAIMITDSENIILENINAHDIQDQYDSGEALSVILINNSENITLKGNINIESIRKANKEINALEIKYSDDIKIQEGNLIINDIKSTSTDSTAILNGIKLLNSNLTSTSPITITDVQGKKYTNGIFLDNNSSLIILAGETNINNLDGFQEVKGINLINQSTLVTSAKININKIGFEHSKSYGIFSNKSNIGSFIEINLSEIKGDLETYGMYFNDTNIFVSTVNILNNKTSSLVRGFEIINSEGLIVKIVQSNETITLNTNNYRLLNVNNSILGVNEIQINSNNTPFCIYTENQTELNLKNINLNKCSQNHITNKDSKITIKESTVSLDKLSLTESQDSFIEVYKPIKFKFYNNGHKIDIDSLLIYNEDEYNYLNEDIKADNFSDDLLYFKKEYKNNILKTKTFSKYYTIGLLSKINEKPIEITLNNLNYEEIQLDFEFLPIEFLEISALKNGVRRSIDHFTVIEKNCSSTLDKSYGCYDIKTSKSLEGEDYILKFKIPTTWLTAKNTSHDKINLYHYENGKYVLLETGMQKLENGFYIYLSEIPSFSEFQISAKEKDSSPNVPDQNTPKEITPPDNNLPVDLCNITCGENQILNTDDCVCVDVIIDPIDCNITCNPDIQYLDEETCQCVDHQDIIPCKIECGPGYRLDRVNCECILVVQDDIRYGTGTYNFITIFILLVIILAIILLIVKLRPKKVIKNKTVKKKKK